MALFRLLYIAGRLRNDTDVDDRSLQFRGLDAN